MHSYTSMCTCLCIVMFGWGCGGSSSPGVGDAGTDTKADVHAPQDAAKEAAPQEASTDACVPAGQKCSVFNCCGNAGCWDPDGTEVVCM
jgi:hypothetical protein